MYGRGHQRWGAREKMPVEREEKVCARERSRHRENVFVRETPRKTTIYRWCMYVGIKQRDGLIGFGDIGEE